MKKARRSPRSAVPASQDGALRVAAPRRRSRGRRRCRGPARSRPSRAARRGQQPVTEVDVVDDVEAVLRDHAVLETPARRSRPSGRRRSRRGEAEWVGAGLVVEADGAGSLRRGRAPGRRSRGPRAPQAASRPPRDASRRLAAASSAARESPPGRLRKVDGPWQRSATRLAALRAGPSRHRPSPRRTGPADQRGRPRDAGSARGRSDRGPLLRALARGARVGLGPGRVVVVVEEVRRPEPPPAAVVVGDRDLLQGAEAVLDVH